MLQSLWFRESAQDIRVTGGVSYTVGGAAAPPTLCFATPTFVRFSGFLTLKRWFLTEAIQNCGTFVDISSFRYLFLYLSIAEHPVNESFCATNFLKAPLMKMVDLT